MKIALSEGGAGWIPYLVERMDYTWERTRLGVDKSIAPQRTVQAPLLELLHLR